MIKRFLLFVILILSYHCHAQSADVSSRDKESWKHKRSEKSAIPPVCYIGFSTGMNNPSGFLGLDFNIKLGKYVTLDAGAGPSTWGNKLCVGGKYYLKPAHRGFAFGGGLTFSSGQENAKPTVQTIYGKEKVTLSFKPQANIFVAAYYYWTIGRKYNRFYVEAGRSVPLHSPHYHEVYGPPLTDDARTFIKRLSPGGYMLGAGFSFALHRI